jgi:hypothetical protein
LLTLAASVKSVAQSSPPLWSASSSYKVGDLAQYANETYRVITAQAAGHVQVPANPTYWEMHEVSAPITLNVGNQQQLPNLTIAWKYIINARVDGSAGLTLNLISNETLNTSFNLDHPFGSSVALSSSNGASVTFSNPAAKSMGFTLDSGHVFSGIYNLQLVGSTEPKAPYSAGVLVTGGANMTLGGVTINSFDIGIDARDNSTIIVGAGVLPQGFDFAAAYAESHSLIDIQSPMTVDGTSLGTAGSQYGFYSTGNSTLEANSCACYGCVDIFVADNAAHLSAVGSTAQNNLLLGAGFLANSGGSIDASNSKTEACTSGYVSEYKSFINALNCHCSNPGSTDDFQVFLGSMINAAGQTGGTVFSTPKNTLSADGSYIAD